MENSSMYMYGCLIAQLEYRQVQWNGLYKIVKQFSIAIPGSILCCYLASSVLHRVYIHAYS